MIGLRPSRLVVPVALLVAAGCSRGPEAPAEPPAAPAVTGVTVEAVATRPLPETIDAVGTVASRTRTVVSSRLVATVAAVVAREGQRVRAGDPLVLLDDRDVTAQGRRAEAAVREARSAVGELERALEAATHAVEGARSQRDLAAATLDRYRALRERGSVAPQEYDEVAARQRAAAAEVERAEAARASVAARRAQVAARIEQAEAELASARVLASHARILAPADGIVVSRTAEVGALAAPGVPLLALEEERYRLEAQVGEQAIGRLRPGQRARVTVDAAAGERSGTIAEIVPAADPASRTVTVKLDLTPADGLRSGLHGRALFTVGERPALLVPRAAVVTRGQLESVFVVDDGAVARLRLVTTGRAAGDRVEVLSGLEPGERIVVGGAERLSDGRRVEPRG